MIIQIVPEGVENFVLTFFLFMFRKKLTPCERSRFKQVHNEYKFFFLVAMTTRIM